MGMEYGYAITYSQDPSDADRQVNALKEYGILDRDIYIDNLIGNVKPKALCKGGRLGGIWYSHKETQFDKLLGVVSKGDIIVVTSLHSIGRNYEWIKDTWQHVTKDLGVNIKVLDMPLADTRIDRDNMGDSFVADLILQILSDVAETNKKSRKANQRQGIERARLKGTLGRPKATYPPNWRNVYKEWKDKKITATKAMEKMNLKRNTFYKLANQYEAGKK